MNAKMNSKRKANIANANNAARKNNRKNKRASGRAVNNLG